MFRLPEKARVVRGNMASPPGAPGGCFLFTRRGVSLRCIAATGMGWEHVSVSAPDRVPTWEEMCAVKGVFWEPEDVVMQLHPAESNYINRHPNVLHLWRPIGQPIPTPPTILV